MTAYTGRVARRQPAPEHIDLLFAAIAISFLLHVIAGTGLYITSSLKSAAPVKPKPVPYVVHLVDPGPPLKHARTPDPVKNKKIRVKKQASLEKIVAKPKTIVPVEKKMVFTKKKTVKPAAKKKRIPKEVKKEAEITKKIQRKKTGGKIDIRKFPYEWYLQLMESRIYQNWDTLSINFFTDKPILVTVYFQIGRSGAVDGLKIEQSSESGAIDASALKAVEQSAPFPPLPPGYKEKFLEVHFGFKIDPGS